MPTLFQIHANFDTLKTKTHEMSLLWHSGDSLILLGTTALMVDWLEDYIVEINADEESRHPIKNIANVYVLSEDIEAINQTAKDNITFATLQTAQVSVISDKEWVKLTQAMNRIITLA